MAPGALADQIREWARELGFSAIGIAPASSVPEELLSQWLAQGYHGRMGYLERNANKRLDPKLVLPGARSLICLALNYYHDYRLPYGQPDRGAVSRYASGGDYHRVMGDLLQQLKDRLRDLAPSAEMLSYVDTGPVLEKYWAARAGIGWIGKHTNLLSKRRMGSWFFLGEILTDLELDCDQPSADHCGTCRRCIDACPTDAIVEPYVLDGSRCISYLTIELRGDIPTRHRAGMGNLVFGCDICQDVCPWNRKVENSSIEEFKPLPERIAPSLAELAQLDEAEFRSGFKGSPILRAKYRGFMRNVAVAMGNSGDTNLVAPLQRLLQNPEPMVRRHAAWALDRLLGPDARALLEESLRGETDEETIRELNLLLAPAR